MERVPHVAPHQVAEPDEIEDVQWLIQPEVGRDPVDVDRGDALAAVLVSGLGERRAGPTLTRIKVRTVMPSKSGTICASRRKM